MKKITIKKQKDCDGCLFAICDPISCRSISKLLTGFDCVVEGVIFELEKAKRKEK